MEYILEDIARITFELQIIYSRLTLLEVSKDIEPNYEKDKKELLDALAILKEEEKEAYKPLKEDYMTAVSALEKFCKLENDNVSEKLYLCQKRIKNNLTQIVYETGIYEENEDFIDSYLEEEFYTHLFFDRNFSKEEMQTFIENVLPVINASISRHYISTINEDIKNPSNFNIKRLLINKKLDWIFEKGGSLEDEALANNFNILKMNLNEEISIPNIPESLKQEFINYEIKNKVFDMLSILAAFEDKEDVLEEIEWFKTYLLYLDEKAIENARLTILGYNFQNKEIKNILLRSITNANLLKRVHNQDSKSYSK